MGTYSPDSYPRRIRPGSVPVGRRGAPRLRLSIPASLISLYDRRRCILIDLSCTGAQIGLGQPMREGESVVLQVAGIEPFADVVREAKGPNGGVNGLLFDPPISERDVLGVRTYSERYEKDELRALRGEVRKWVTGA